MGFARVRGLFWVGRSRTEHDRHGDLQSDRSRRRAQALRATPLPRQRSRRGADRVRRRRARCAGRCHGRCSRGACSSPRAGSAAGCACAARPPSSRSCSRLPDSRTWCCACFGAPQDLWGWCQPVVAV